MNYTLLFILLPIIAILPVFFLKNYVKERKNIYILYSFIGYILLTRLYICLLEKGEMSKLFCISQILQILLIVIGGAIIYSETITSNKIIGIGISIIALYFLSK